MCWLAVYLLVRHPTPEDCVLEAPVDTSVRTTTSPRARSASPAV
eukprot:COSAG01_NODE_32219_length_584_cov_2.313402_1_plen_43_part_10